MPLGFEILTEKLEFLLRRQAFEIHDRDLGRPLGFAAEKLFVTIEEHLQQQRASLKTADVITLPETLHHRQLREDLECRVSVGDACRTLTIELNKAVGVIGKE